MIMSEFTVDQMWDMAMEINNKTVEEWPENEEELARLIRNDLTKPVEQWSEQDKRDWRAMGYRVPRRRK
tara:strand:+ start:792 stop:998 length:207 start_codon:yes stop_codon:yes gene_type:complete